jgi:hypothetical protein
MRNELFKDVTQTRRFELLRSKAIRGMGATALLLLTGSGCQNTSGQPLDAKPSASKLATVPTEVVRCTGLTIDKTETKTAVTAHLTSTTTHAWRSHMIENSRSGDFPPVNYDAETAGLSVPISLHAPFDGVVRFSVADVSQPTVIINCPAVLATDIPQK